MHTLKETKINAKYPSSLLTLYCQFKILQFLLVFLLFSFLFLSEPPKEGEGEWIRHLTIHSACVAHLFDIN